MMNQEVEMEEQPALGLSWRLTWRLPLFFLHVFIVLPFVLLCFLPGLQGLQTGGMKLQQRAQRFWQRQLLRIFGIRRRVHGRLPSGAALVVANHISWLDIVVLHSIWPMALVAKDEIRRWPLVGRLAAVAGTLFIVRGQARSRQRVSSRMAAMLRRGDRVGVFPEGGISPEYGVGRFHSALFAPAIRARRPVVPVAIRYQRGSEDLHEAFVMRRGENFIRNFFRLLSQPASEVQVMIGEALFDWEEGRRHLAEQAAAVVRDFYNQSWQP